MADSEVKNIKLDEPDETQNWEKIEAERNTYRINPKQFAQGIFGSVHEARDKADNKIAAKAIGGFWFLPAVKHLKSNLEKLLKLDHANIVRMVDGHMDTDKFWIFMQFCRYGDLNDYLQDKTFLPEQLVEQIFIPCAEGLKYLHGQNVIHRDIKPANILVNGKECIKLADFDFCKIFEENYATSGMETNVGTRPFQAPEIFDQERYRRDVDTFSLGVSFLAVIQKNWKSNPLSGKKMLVPYCEDESLNDQERKKPIGFLLSRKEGIKVVSVVENRPLPDIVSQVKLLISQMTCVKPDDRLKAAEVLQKLVRMSQVTPVRLAKATTWSTVTVHSMFVNKLDQLVVCRGHVEIILDGRHRGCGDKPEFNHHLTMFNRQQGTVIKEVPLQCDTGPCYIIEHPTDPNYVLHARSYKLLISTVNLDTGSEKTVWTSCRCENKCKGGKCSGLRLEKLCKGPAGSVLVLLQNKVGTKPEREYRVAKWEWQSEAKEFHAVRETKLDVLDLGYWSAEMCYIESHDILVITCGRNGTCKVYGMRLSDGSRVWKLSGAVAGKDMFPCGVCSDPEGRVYVADAYKKRLLVLDGKSGFELQVLMQGEKFGDECIPNICWSDTSPQLTMYHSTMPNYYGGKIRLFKWC